MRNKDRFYEAFVHVRHRVMGYRLKDFKLYHRLWLEAMESPLVLGGEVSVVDLELAALICSSERDEIPMMVERGSSGCWSWRGWWFALRSIFLDPGKEAVKFHGYLEDHVCGPDTHAGGDPGGVGFVEFPPTMDQVCAVIRATGWEPALVWDMGPGEVEWYMAGVYRHRGADVGIKSEHDEEMEAGMKARKESELAEKEKGGGDE
jgi:hypothetical protein